MKLSEFKNHLSNVSSVNFIQPNGKIVPSHFHITEAGLTTKHFIDCGSTVRTEKTASMQVWVAQDTNHRLEPTKLQKILALSDNLFGNEDLELEIEYQADTIGRYGVAFNGSDFLLTPKQTDCLAKENCGTPNKKQELVTAESQASCCTPGGGCC